MFKLVILFVFGVKVSFCHTRFGNSLDMVGITPDIHLCVSKTTHHLEAYTNSDQPGNPVF